jgi:AraC family transcriptional regulator of adaptative response/methylated-DNA-[protein]-cysteine methyltransferase
MNSIRLNDDSFYDALLRKDSQFEGLFFAGIKSTGIFCRPTCRARKPKRENVEFFATAGEALANGYRPCKICNPMEHAGETPGEIRELFRALEKNPGEKISDYALAMKGIDPGRIRRWFKKHHGMTFQSYQRLIRINGALRNIKNGGKVIDAAFDSGYESLSGFSYSFKKATAKTPSESKFTDSLVFTRFATPLGPMVAVANDEGICLLEFTDRRMLETELNQLRKHFKSQILPGTNSHIERLMVQVKEYFEGTRREFDVPLVTPGTVFQKAAWKRLLDIPYGATVSYKHQAIALGNPNAVRAVAQANGCNRISIVIPCHRVIGEDGSLTGYGGGLQRKQWLIDHERRNSKR